jgi:hypothetical protein
LGFTGLPNPTGSYNGIMHDVTAGDTQFVHPAFTGQRVHLGLQLAGSVDYLGLDPGSVIIGENWDMPPLLIENIGNIYRAVTMRGLPAPASFATRTLGVFASPAAGQLITPSANYGVVLVWETGSGTTPDDYLETARSLGQPGDAPDPSDPLSALGAHLAVVLDNSDNDDEPFDPFDDYGLIIFEAWPSKEAWRTAWEQRIQPAIRAQTDAEPLIAAAKVLSLAVPAADAENPNGGAFYQIDL